MREAALRRLGARLMGRLGLGVVALGAIGGGWAIADSKDSAGEKATPKGDPIAIGSEIFHREWLPKDSRQPGGDGLGPVFNDSSCIACHNSGGSGGAGPVSKNIDILSASAGPGILPNSPPPAIPGGVPAPTANAQLEPLFDFHAGFRSGTKTVVLHKFGTDPGYDAFRSKLLAPARNAQIVGQPFGDGGLLSVDLSVTETGFDTIIAPGQAAGGKSDARLDAAMARMNEVKAAVLANRAGMTGALNVGTFVVTRSQRNPTPLFGLGLVDAIPESSILAMAGKQAKEAPEVAGRPARVADGRIGRLGWKGQTANSEDFVLNACAVEVGLEVPGHSQSITPQAPRYKASGLDLNQGECDSLVAYVRSIPRPVERASANAAEVKFLGAGKDAFARVGCASCHSARLGEVEGLYSDLLLHDMGDEIADSGSYDDNGSSDEPLLPGVTADNGRQRVTIEVKSALKREWRTPPLWGFRDSGPYLHDGRAQTLEQAVALHGGQGSASALKFFQLPSTERLQLEAFLKSLVAPTPGVGYREVARSGE